MKNWIQKHLIGRYGIDQLSIALIYLSLFIFILAIPFRSLFIRCSALIPLLISYYRIFSKQCYKRQQENFKFIRFYNPIRKRLQTRARQIKEFKTHKYFKCPKCHQMLRVPRHKGNITITCQKCHHVFHQHS